MLPAKIKLTEQVIHKIKTARIEKRIPAAVLARAIKRDDSYISSLESMRLRTISAVDLVTIIGFLFDIPEQMAAEKAEEFIASANKPDSYSAQDLQYPLALDDIADAMLVNEPAPKGYLSDAKTDYAEPELISDMLEVLAGLITDFYKADPKEAVFVLNSFIKTMKFDPVFTMSVMGIPFFKLKQLSVDKRKEVFEDILAVFRKHTAIANNTNR